VYLGDTLFTVGWVGLDGIEGVTSGNDEQRVDARLEAEMKWRGTNEESEDSLISLPIKTSSMMIAS
jgi:hypothetical protein